MTAKKSDKVDSSPCPASKLVVVIVAICAMIPPTLVAYASLMQGEGTTIKADTIIEKADEIHTLVNSNLEKVTSALETANEKISGLERLIKEISEGKTESEHDLPDRIVEPKPPVRKKRPASVE